MIAETAYDQRRPLAVVEQDQETGALRVAVEQAPVASVLRREQTTRRLLALADLAAVLLAIGITTLATGAATSWVELGLPVLLVVSAKLRGLYDRDDLVIRKSTLAELSKLLGLAALMTAADYLIHRTIVQRPFPESAFIADLFVGLSGLLVAGRVVARKVASSIVGRERCLIIGNERASAHLREVLGSLRGVDVVGSAPFEQFSNSEASVRQLIVQLDAHRLVIAPHSQISEETTLEVIKHAKLTGLPVSIFPSIWAAIGGSVVFDDLGGSTLLGIPRFGLTRSSRRVKRAFDLFVALSVLIVSAPAFALIAVLIKLDGPGPVFFRQTRVGLSGRRFSMFKFRSMVDGADAMKLELLSLNEAGEGLFKIANDPRSTRVGGYLRRAHLDELPQLLNVIRGEMSLVGPRPLVEAEDALFVEECDRARLRLTPGMTGPWQLRGPLTTPLAEMAKLDYLYISNWGLWADILILLRTAERVFERRGQ